MGRLSGKKWELIFCYSYTPFGLSFADNYFKEAYRHDYQGQYAEKDAETGWNAFELRMYDPIIARWMRPDPYGQFASPYLAMGNNPKYTDPDGGFIDDIVMEGITITASRLSGDFLRFSGNMAIAGKSIGHLFNAPSKTIDINYSLSANFENNLNYRYQKKPTFDRVNLNDPMAGENLVGNLRQLYAHYLNNPGSENVYGRDVVDPSTANFNMDMTLYSHTQDYEISGQTFSVSFLQNPAFQPGKIPFGKHAPSLKPPDYTKDSQGNYIGKLGVKYTLSWGAVNINYYLEHHRVNKESFKRAWETMQKLRNYIVGRTKTLDLP
ncbi:MAG: RHS repeat-associated core domain-containing protein [Verrucomicrobiota bacterium]